MALAIHLDIECWRIIMLDYIDSLCGIEAFKYARDIRGEKEIAITKYDPAALSGQIRCQEPRQ